MVATWASRFVNKCFTSQIVSFFLEIKVRLLFKVTFMINWEHCRCRRRRLRPLRVRSVALFRGSPADRSPSLPNLRTSSNCHRLLPVLPDGADRRSNRGKMSPRVPRQRFRDWPTCWKGQVRNRLLSQKQGNRCCYDSLGFPRSTGKSWAVTDETNFDTTNPGRRSLPVAPERRRKHG